MPTMTAEQERQRGRGEALYARDLKDTLEREHMGEIVAIHPDSGDYTLGRYRTEVARAIRRNQPEGFIYLTRIGPSPPISA